MQLLRREARRHGTDRKAWRSRASTAEAARPRTQRNILICRRACEVQVVASLLRTRGCHRRWTQCAGPARREGRSRCGPIVSVPSVQVVQHCLCPYVPGVAAGGVEPGRGLATPRMTGVAQQISGRRRRISDRRAPARAVGDLDGNSGTEVRPAQRMPEMNLPTQRISHCSDSG